MKHLPASIGAAALCALVTTVASAEPASIDSVLRETDLREHVIVATEFDDGLGPDIVADGLSIEASYAAPVLLGKEDTAQDERTPTFVSGRHGQALRCDEATTNLLTRQASGIEPSAAAFHAIGDATIERDDTVAHVGEASMRVRCRGADGVAVRTARSVRAGQPISGSVWLRGEGRVRLRLFDQSNYRAGAFRYVKLTSSWTRYTVNALQPAPVAAEHVQLEIRAANAGQADFHVDALQVEPLPYATAWVPGGTARGQQHAVYDIPKQLRPIKEGTMLIWARVHWPPELPQSKPPIKHITSRRCFVVSRTASPSLMWEKYNRLRVRHHHGHPRFRERDLRDGDWHFMAVTWTPDHTGAMHNSEYRETQNGMRISHTNAWRIGLNANADMDQWIVLDRALSESELRSVYAAFGGRGAKQ